MELLRIDVDAELRTLAEARIQGRWAAPAEFVRWAVSRGATSVNVECSAWGFFVRCYGAAVSNTEVFHLRTIVDQSRSDESRHKAIVALEEYGSDVFLFAARTKFELIATCNGQRWILNTAEDRDALLEEDSDARDELVLKVFIAGFEAVKARWWLHENCRFTPIKVDVDGERVDRGFDRGLFRQSLHSPLEGSLAITMDDASPLLILLQFGVVSTRATIPGFFPFRAAVDLGDLVEYGAPPMRLRARVTEFMPAIVDEAVAFLMRLVGRLPSLASASRHRISAVLLEAAAQGYRTSEILKLPLIEIASQHGESQMVSAYELFEANHELQISTPGGKDIGEGTVLLTDEERRQLAVLGDVRLVRATSRPKAVFMTRFRRLLRWLFLVFVDRRRDFVNEEDLDDDERMFLNRLQSTAVYWNDGEPVRWRWTEACRPLMVRRGPVAAIAQGHRSMSRLIDVVRQDKAWITPVLFALDEGGEFALESITAQNRRADASGVEP